MIENILRRSATEFTGAGIGLTVATMVGDQSSVYNFHDLKSETAFVPTAHTLYEIGSITKVFSTTLLARLIVNHRLDPQQPLATMLPEVPHLPPSITPLSLATHTSGLPRLPDNFADSARKDWRDPYAHYTEQDLLTYLSTVTESDIVPRSGLIAYSNLGAGLLGYTLARFRGMSYEEAIVQHLCRPLSLDATTITLPDHRLAQLAPAHSAAGKPTSNYHFQALAGAGALYSTADDLLRFMHAHFTQPEPLSEALAYTLQLQRTKFAPAPRHLRVLARARNLLFRSRTPKIEMLGIGLGWLQARLPQSGATVWMHNGATGGYHSFMAFARQSQTGVIVLNNRGFSMWDTLLPRYSVDNLGIELLDALLA